MTAYQTLNLRGGGLLPPGSTKFKSPAIHRTPLYRARSTYRDMMRRAENNNSKNPAYSKVKLLMTMEEFLEWSLPLYIKFIEENPESSPSVARRGDKGHYELGNIEIVSKEENRATQEAKLLLKSDGTKLCSRCKESKVAKGNFSINKGRPDGLCHWCKPCMSAYRK